MRVTASDAPGTRPRQSLTSAREAIHSPSTIRRPKWLTSKLDQSEGARRNISFTAKDALSWIDKAEYSVNGGDWTLLEPINKVTDSQTLDYQVDANAGQLIAIRVFDEDDNVVVKQFGL